MRKLKKCLVTLILVSLIFGVTGFAPAQRLPGQVLVWVRPEELMRGPGSPEMLFLVANTTAKPLSLSSITPKVEGVAQSTAQMSRPLPVLTPDESKTLADILAGTRVDFPPELATKVCILSVPTGIEHDGKSEKSVRLSAEIRFDDGSFTTLESAAILTTSLPAESGWVAGDGHIHTDFSDGGYSVYQRRNDAINFGYKWIFITDHSGSLSSTYSSYVTTCADADGTNLAIGPDQEVSAYGGGHYLAYRCNSALLSGVWAESYLPTYVTNNNSPNSFGGVAHPNHFSYPWSDFPRSSAVYRFVELFSNERIPSSTTLSEWRDQLELDLPSKIAGGDTAPFTVGVAGSDAHFVLTPYWGKNMTYLKANLTPPTIGPAYQALLAGQAVASGDGSFARFTMGSKQIGQVLSTSSSSISVNYYIKGATPSTIIRWFRLIRVTDGSIVPNSGEAPNSNLYQGTKNVTFAATDDAYYLEVELQDSGGVTQRVYTNPIFLNR